MNPKNKKQTTFKRRQYYIKKGFQARFIARFFMILILGGMISMGLTFLNNQDTLTAVYANSRLVIQNTSIAIMPSVMFTTILTTLVLGIVVIVVTLLVSHKIAGPVFRFERDIERVARGDLKSRINIRKGDQFQELAVALNEMVQSLSERVSAVREEGGEKAAKMVDRKFQL